MSFLEKLLQYYSMTYEEYLVCKNKITKEDIPHFSNFKNLSNITSYLKNAINDNKKILIYGDYDTDGILSTAILYKSILKLGVKPGYYIPFREKDGYGLTIDNIKKFKKLNYDLIICVDNGITLIEQVNLLKSLGMDIIIIDHHSIGNSLPNTENIVHWNISKFTNYNISAGLTSFYFSWSLLNEFDEYLFTLAAITTISDLMPVKELNRKVIILGLEFLNKNRYRQFELLLNTNQTEYDEEIVGIYIVPKINAIGRLITNNSLFYIVKYFIEDTDLEKISHWITTINDQRKEKVLNLSNNLFNNINYGKDSIVSVIDIEEGLLGLVANKLLEKYNLPTCILTYSLDKNILKGSIRTKNGFDLTEFLQENNSLFLTCGGHSFAGGVSLELDKYNEFEEKFNSFAKDNKLNEEKSIDISINDVNLVNYEIIQSFAPFGQEHKKPIFKLKEFDTSILTKSKSNEHIITKLSMNSTLVYFNFDQSIFNNKKVDFVGKIRKNEFNDIVNTQFVVDMFYKK